ncbi:MAG: amidinotransferase [Acidobacteria bacterium]|nr:amidinotransferase [Acidobacteriota bacterium]
MTRYTQAVTRRPGPDFAAGLTTAGLGAPDLELALAQHAAYVEALRGHGLEVVELAAEPGYPDACFVEDTAVVTPELAVIARPGASPRQGEERSIEPVLARFRPVARIEAPGTLDGGDVLIVDREVLIGVSARTNVEGARQLADLLRPHGYVSRFVEIATGLHLKASVNMLGSQTLLVAHEYATHPALLPFGQVSVGDDEAYAANTLWINDRLLAPRGFPRVLRSLERLGLPVTQLDVSEFRKMDGGLTCLSLRF